MLLVVVDDPVHSAKEDLSFAVGYRFATMSASELATNKYFPLAHSDLARAT
jgi:hypothetical protein